VVDCVIAFSSCTMQQNKKPPTGDEPAERAGSLPVGGFAFGRPSLDVDFEELS
jgi:hypothetical protein